MPKSKVEVDPGICGLLSTISVESEDKVTANISMKSECPDVMKFGNEIKEIQAMQEVFAPFGDSSIMKAARHCRHSACSVPTAVIKAVEVACVFALPKDVHLKIGKVE